MRISTEFQSVPAGSIPSAATGFDYIERQQAPGSYFRWKFWLDRLLAACLLLPAALVILVIGIMVRLTSPGPVIFRQRRVGRHGRPFDLFKIRTMRIDAEAATGPVWATAGDTRITPLGRVLRKLHLDEFPQLINVIKGEMALVGPRPERPEFTQQLAVRIPNYLDRLTVLPGITGLAQINLPPDSDLDSVRRKVALDLEYIASAGWFLDLRMLLCTAVRLTGIHGELAMRMFALKRVPAVSAKRAGSATPHEEPTALARELTPSRIIGAEVVANHHPSNGTHRNGSSIDDPAHAELSNGSTSNGDGVHWPARGPTVERLNFGD